jgi:hypothetical protein
MSVFKKSAFISPPALIAAYNNINMDINLVPEDIRSRQLEYGAILTLTSNGDIGNIVFTLIGSFNGHIISEQLVGPVNGPVHTTYFYDKIISLRASVNSVQQLFLELGNRSIFVFDLYNTSNANNINYNKIDVMVKSIDANNGWGQAFDDDGNPAGYFVYGLSTDRPEIISNSYVIPTIINQGIGHPNNQRFSLINDISHDITLGDIQNGYFVSTIYPYRTIIVYISSVLETLTFIEIRQS